VRFQRLAFFVIAFIALAGCCTAPRPPSENGGAIRERNEGYSLLHQLMHDESRVGGIFILKHADDPVRDLIKEIAAACDNARKQMDEFPKADNRIEFDVPDLPKLEQESRDLESKADEKDLLHSSGKEFELKLIFTQAQAMGYACNLCRALLVHEDDVGRRTFLMDLLDGCIGFQNRLMNLLAVRS
jgi:hypothetical protein